MSIRIYLVNYDDTSSRLLTYYMEREGWDITTFHKERNPLLHVADCPDLWVLDADVPEWFNIMKAIRKAADDIPIIVTSEREWVMDRVLGLELGCDDLIVKPFFPRELVLRIKKILNRTEDIKPCSNLVRMQDYLLDTNRRLVALNNQYVDLTTKEFDLLVLFAQHKGMALSREQIIRFVWGENYFGSDRVVDDLIRRMRKKLERLRVETLYGYGYRIIS